MNSLNNFRIALVTSALVIGTYASASSLAEINFPDRPGFPTDPTKIMSPSAGETSNWMEAVSPFRSDLEGSHALIVALQALQSRKEGAAATQPEENARAQATVKRALSIAPYNSGLWLALALLQAQHDPRDPALVEALKMSYFIAPNDPQLMPVRLDTATLFDALADPDLKELVRGDLRLMLTRQADLKTAVVSAYQRASSLGKAFLEEAVQSIDPGFVPTLRSQKPT
jgi:hypothetical protein